MRNKLPVQIVSIASLHRQDPCKPCSRTAFLLRACRAVRRGNGRWCTCQKNVARNRAQPRATWRPAL